MSPTRRSTEITVTPKKLAGLVVVTNELAADAHPAALGVVGDGLVRDLRRKIDSAYFGNTVTNGPSGLGSLTTATATNGGTWATLDSFEAAKSATPRHCTHSITAFVAAPATALALSTIKEYGTAGRNKPLLQADPTQPVARSICGVPLYVSPAVAADIVWAIPQTAQPVRAPTGRQCRHRFQRVLHLRPRRRARHAARVVRLHLPARDHEDHEGVDHARA